MHIFVLAWSTTSTAIYCNTLQQTATICLRTGGGVRTRVCLLHTRYPRSVCALITLQHTATHCNTLQHTATHCNNCNTLQHTATHYINSPAYWRWSTHACASVTNLLPSLWMRMRSSSRCSIFSRISHIVLLLDLAVYRLLKNSDFWEILTFEKFDFWKILPTRASALLAGKFSQKTCQ